MDNPDFEQLKESIGKLTDAEQDHLAAFLLMQRLKRNQLVMPAIHQRIEDADPENWETLNKAQDSISK
ncbi:MAG: hypothetical protein AB8F34_00340 [Akkermansiaceae bacterium]